MINPVPLVLIGPSGVGKSTLARTLETTGDFEIIRSYTTRPRRQSDDESTHVFVDDAAYDQLDAAGTFIGGTEVFGHRYALPHLKSSNKRPVIIIRAPLVPLCRQLFPGCIIVALTAPIPILIDRIHERGDHERVADEQFDAELAMGKSVTPHSVDTTQPIEGCVQQIIAMVSAP